MDGLKIAVLGPLRAWRDGHELPTGPAQQRAVLAALALRGGRVVPVQELLDDVWGWAPPASATAALRNHVLRLRSVLEPDPRSPVVLVSESGGYALRLDPAALDSTRCEQLRADAERALEAGDREGSARLIREALALWDGEALTGVPGNFAERQRQRLTETRLTLQESFLELELRLGRHAEAAAELSALAEAHPVREGLRALEMLALYRCGRQSDALAAYGRTRRFLSQELGIDPGPDLARLHERILRSDPDLEPPIERVTKSDRKVTVAPFPPAHLPPDAPDFIGRQPTVEQLSRVLAKTAGRIGGSATVCVIHGMGGVGKTTVAVHAGHAVREIFPDGQLYIDLRGASRDPLSPEAVQRSFLRALGVSFQDIPADAAERTNLYRSRLDGRRLLLLLDNAVSREQVMPLLPASAECAVLITSRTPLVGLPVTSRTALEPFDETEALALLERIAGPDRLPKEPEAARVLVRACGFLPLAVRIAASRLASRPRWSVSALAARLADSSRRLNELQAGGLAVEAAFELGYTSLSDPEARAFRLLAIPELVELTPGIAGAVLNTTEDSAEELMESLANAGVLESFAPGHYRYHDLLRLFAGHRALKTDAADQRKDALRRLASFHLAGISNALRVVNPHSRLVTATDPHLPNSLRFKTYEEAQSWVINEVDHMLRVAAQIADDSMSLADADDARIVGRTLVHLTQAADYDVAWGSFVPLGQMLLDEAEAEDDFPAIVNACAILALAHASSGRYEQAHGFARQGYVTAASLDPDIRHHLAYIQGMVAAMDPDSVDDPTAHFANAATLSRAAGDSSFEGLCLLGLVTIHLTRREPSQALPHCHQMVMLSQAGDNAYGIALSLRHLGRTLHELGRSDEALEHYTRALALCDAHFMPTQSARALLGLAGAQFAVGRRAEARASAIEALRQLTQLADRDQHLALDLLNHIEPDEHRAKDQADDRGNTAH
ncbi:BTAD domain-containing putative transcriptional regulator [Streptomyces sp. NPDC059193]|uniref:AfsR/SARP family transcriptional regulator n=1 Tax=Streptomyces sp. NPDC059193 TaxID=3346763 RepID=UPI00367D93E3